MKKWYDNNIAPAVARIDKLMGVKHIQVAYEPTLWVLDGTDFYCEHATTDTQTYLPAAPSYETGDEDEYEVTVEFCTDCKEDIER